MRGAKIVSLSWGAAPSLMGRSSCGDLSLSVFQDCHRHCTLYISPTALTSVKESPKTGSYGMCKKRSETVKIFKSLEISLTPPELELSKTTSAFQVFRCEEAAWYVINSGNLERLLLGDDTNSMQFDGNMKRFRMTPFLNEEKQVQWKRE